MRVSVALIFALLAPGCDRREASLQVKLRSNRLPAGLFDRLTVEVRARGASEPCAGCVREFDGGDLTGPGEASFAVVAPGQALSVRAALWRSRGKGQQVASSVAVTAAVEAGAGEVELRLPWDAVGRALGSWERPLAPSEVPPLPPDPVVGGGCGVAPGEGEACAPGGLFWLGDAGADLLGGVDREGRDERLVLLSPFVIDVAEVTVGQLRASQVETPLMPIPKQLNAACTYTASPGDGEDLPVTCLVWTMADKHCRSLGKRLPTEAELSYLMGGMRSRRFVWGEVEPECRDTVFNDAGCGRSGPSRAGQGDRDRLLLGDRAVVDLAGNVAEWALDRWNSTREGCFAPALLRDPRCDAPSPSLPDGRVVVGGSWSFEVYYLGSSLRFGLDGDQAYSESVGFRCARSVGP